MDRVAVGFPAIPNASKRERRAVFHLEVIRLSDLPTGSLPFVKTVCGNEAPTSLKRLAEGRFLIDRLDARVDETLRLFAPERNQSPLQVRDFSNRVALEDGEDVLRRGNVVTRDDIVQIESI